MKFEKTKRIICCALSFLIPCGLMLAMLAVWDVMPFGSKTVLVGDAGGQYYPFAMLLRRLLRSGESLLYSWRVGFGSSLIPEFAYYCSNLYDLAACLLPEQMVTPFLCVSVCTRLGTAGLFFNCFLITLRKKPTFAEPVFASFYALCGWAMANCFQLIWLDCFAMVPLVLAALVLLVRDRDMRFYPLALGACLFSNYYFSFSICCMAVLFWIGLLIVLRIPRGELLKASGRFFGCSLLAAGLAAVLLIPTGAALRNTSAAGMEYQGWKEVCEPLTLLLAQLSPFGFLRINKHPVNFAAGILPLFCCFGFLTERRIARRERIYAGGLMLFLLLSLWWSPLNYAWHGFHEPRFTVDRFAYLVPLVLCYMGWRLFSVQTQDCEKRLTVLLRTAGMLLLAILPVCFAIKEKQTDISGVCIVLLLLYGICWLISGILPKQRQRITLVISAFAVMEMVLTANLTVQRVKSQQQDVDWDAMSRAMDDIRQDTAENSRENLDRIGLRIGSNDFVNKGLLQNVPYQTAAFSSMNKAPLLTFCQKCGMIASPIGADYSFQELSPFAMQLFDICYMVMEKPPVFGTSLSAYPEDETQVYRSDAERTAGFCIPLQDAYSFDPDADPYTVQNAIFAEMTGLDEPLFSFVMPEFRKAKDLSVTQIADDSFSYQPSDPQKDPMETHPSLTFQYTIPDDGCYGVFYAPDNDDWEGYEIWDGQDQIRGNFYYDGMQQYYNAVLMLGRLESGKELTFRFYPKRESAGSLRLYLAKLNEETCAAGLAVLREHSLLQQQVDDTLLSGTVTASEDRMLYLSVPYDKGWTAAVDGVKTETVPLYGAMTGIPLSAGTHTVRLRFMPVGLIAGGAGSAVSLAVYLVLCIASGRKLRRSRNEQRSEE